MSARAAGDSAAARWCGLGCFFTFYLGLAPQALFRRPLRGLSAPVHGFVNDIMFVVVIPFTFRNGPLPHALFVSYNTRYS